MKNFKDVVEMNMSDKEKWIEKKLKSRSLLKGDFSTNFKKNFKIIFKELLVYALINNGEYEKQYSRFNFGVLSNEPLGYTKDDKIIIEIVYIDDSLVNLKEYKKIGMLPLMDNYKKEYDNFYKSMKKETTDNFIKKLSDVAKEITLRGILTKLVIGYKKINFNY